MNETAFETRLVTLSSSQRKDDAASSSTNFYVSMANSSGAIRDRVIGVSIESVGFVNFIENVRPKNTSITVVYFNGFVTTETNFAIPSGIYDDIGLSVVLQESIYTYVFGGIGPVLFTVEAVHPQNGNPAYINMRMLQPAPAYIQLVYSKVGLPYIIGMKETETFITSISPSRDFRPNLYGALAVTLNSRALTSSHHSVDHEGNPTGVMITIPVDQAYGNIVSMHVDGASRPTVSIGDDRNLSGFDISLRHYDDGELVDLSGGEMYVTLRYWLYST